MNKASLLLTLFCFVFLACVSSGRKIDPAAADKIERGKTTKAEVIALLGSPDHITRSGRGNTIFMYNYFRVSAKPATFLPVIGPLVGGAHAQHQMFMVTFGPDDRVTDYITSYGASEVDSGLAIGGKAEIADVEAGKRPK